MNLRRILSQAALVIGALVFSIGLQAYAASFVGPAEGFPNSDAQAPLDTGVNTNIKTGNLGVNVVLSGGSYVSGPYTNGLTVGGNMLVPWGNVGIGTVSPGAKLEISDANPSVYVNPTGAAGSSSIWLRSAQDSGAPLRDWRIQATGGNSIDRFSILNSSSGTTPFTITSGDDVGIGVASPAAKLDVAGAIKVGDTSTCTAGAIRFRSNDFEGCVDGTTWKSLTASGGGPSGSQTWSTPGVDSFTVPSGVSVISITAAGGAGAGGCGGGSDKVINGGGGGGGGAGSIGTRVGYAVTQGDVFNLLVGVGGINPANCGGTQTSGNGNVGSPGQSSSVTKVSTGALVVSGTLGSGGSSGIYSSGAAADPGASCPPYGTGGGGASGPTAYGSPGGTCSGGGGGGGGNTSTNPAGSPGGDGGAGFITISW